VSTKFVQIILFFLNKHTDFQYIKFQIKTDEIHNNQTNKKMDDINVNIYIHGGLGRARPAFWVLPFWTFFGDSFFFRVKERYILKSFKTFTNLNYAEINCGADLYQDFQII
jgi:hypothetical protein